MSRWLANLIRWRLAYRTRIRWAWFPVESESAPSSAGGSSAPFLGLPRAGTAGPCPPRERFVFFSAYGAYRRLRATALIEVQPLAASVCSATVNALPTATGVEKRTFRDGRAGDGAPRARPPPGREVRSPGKSPGPLPTDPAPGTSKYVYGPARAGCRAVPRLPGRFPRGPVSHTTLSGSSRRPAVSWVWIWVPM